MKRFGPKDITYASLFDARYESLIPLITRDPDFWSYCEKYYNDHHSIKLKHGVEFLAVSKTDDIVTYPGLSYCMQLILGGFPTTFNFMCAGSGLDLPSPFQQTLISEASSRINMTTSGTIARLSGGIIKFLANFPSGFQTITVRESGVNTASIPNTGTLLNRNVFSSNPIVHTAGGTAFVLETRINFAGLL